MASIPPQWNHTHVISIHKKGPPSVVANYRPITLTNSCCKIFEGMLNHKLLLYLNTNKLISSSQHGFLHKHSTCSNLLESADDWTSCLDRGIDTLILYVDFAKAFDSVSVPKLILKLKSIGITGNFLKIVSSLLNNRSQKVKVGNILSRSRPVVSGVPQGSVLGPILFLLFINDLSSSLPSDSISKLFADDVKSYIQINTDMSHIVFSNLINAIELWSNKWQLPLAVSKCTWMLLSNRIEINRPSYSFIMAGLELDGTDEIKDLGVIFNSKLGFDGHIDNMVARAKQRLFLLKKSFVSKDSSVLIFAFKTYFTSTRLLLPSMVSLSHHRCTTHRIYSKIFHQVSSYLSQKYIVQRSPSDLRADLP